MLQNSQTPSTGMYLTRRTIRSFRLGTVEPLADGFLFCFFLAKLGVLFPDLAGMVKSFLSLFVYLLEWA